MIPITAHRFVSPVLMAPGGRLLWGRSHMQLGHCRNVKNLASAVEPAAAPIRLILRDGH